MAVCPILTTVLKHRRGCGVGFDARSTSAWDRPGGLSGLKGAMVLYMIALLQNGKDESDASENSSKQTDDVSHISASLNSGSNWLDALPVEFYLTS